MLVGLLVRYLLTENWRAGLLAAVKEFILKIIPKKSPQTHGHRKHDFQLEMHQKAFSGRAPPGPAGGAYSALPDPLAGLMGPNSKVREK